jgi:hypothetical protein
MGKVTKWVVAWDFVRRPKRTFYQVLADEFSPTEARRVQRSVAECQDDYTARRLRALLAYYGASVVAYAINGASLDDARADREADQFVERIHAQRLSRRGLRS